MPVQLCYMTSNSALESANQAIAWNVAPEYFMSDNGAYLIALIILSNKAVIGPE